MELDIGEELLLRDCWNMDDSGDAEVVDASSADEACALYVGSSK